MLDRIFFLLLFHFILITINNDNQFFFFFIIYYFDINRYLFLSSIASESDSGSGLMFLINLLAGILSVYPNVYIPLDLLLQFMTS